MKIRQSLYFILFILCFFLSPKTQAETIDKIIAKVGTEVITLSDLNQERKEQKAFLINAYGKTKGTQAFQKKQKNLLDEMVLDTLLKTEIKNAGLEASDEQVEKEIDAVIKQQNLNKITFSEKLAKNGLTMNAYRKRLRFEIESQSFIQKKIMPLVNISDYDLQQEYKKNIKDYQTYDKLRFIEAFLPPDKFSSEEEMKKTASKIHSILKSNGSATALIKKYSSGPFAKKGGDSGLVQGSSLRPELLSLLNRFKPGQTTTPIPMQDGIVIFKLLSKKDPKPLPYNKVISQVRSRYADKVVQDELKKYLLSIKEQTYVEILK